MCACSGLDVYKRQVHDDQGSARSCRTRLDEPPFQRDLPLAGGKTYRLKCSKTVRRIGGDALPISLHQPVGFYETADCDKQDERNNHRKDGKNGAYDAAFNIARIKIYIVSQFAIISHSDFLEDMSRMDFLFPDLMISF